MNTLIIGAAGFVGGYLISKLQEKGSVMATKLPFEKIETEIPVYDLDILDEQAIITLLEQTKPDAIVHLAAQSSVALSWKNPQLTTDINIKGSMNLLEAVRKLGISPRILLVGSGEEYGAPRIDQPKISETDTPHPQNIYAITKLCQNMIGTLYANAYNMDIMCVRAFNHIGPRQLPNFVVSDFSKQIAEMECGRKEPVLYTGNLSAKRDFTDVRDVVNAYALLLEKGKKGETYNVGSGTAVAISEILEMLIRLSDVKITQETDPAKLRPIDVPVIEADISKLVQDTAWERKYSLKDTLKDTLDYWRENL